MGSFMSYPRTTEPEIYELPSHEQSNQDDQSKLSTLIHEVNVRICEHIVQEGVCSRNEQANFDVYRQSWNRVVADLKTTYPQWTPRDFLNLRHQFKAFDSNDLYLLDYDGFNKALDFNQDNSSPEQRRAVFESVDTHHHNFINFMQYLQVMNDINIGSPVTQAPKTEDSKDPAILDIISNVRVTDPCVQMSYKLF